MSKFKISVFDKSNNEIFFIYISDLSCMINELVGRIYQFSRSFYTIKIEYIGEEDI